jgi:hypothetical protein
MYTTNSQSRNPTNLRNDAAADDEALARALQEEYEREYRRRSMQQHLPPPNHVPRNQRSTRTPAVVAAPPLRASAPPESFLTSTPPAVVVGGVDDDDDAIFGKPFYFDEPDIPIDLRFSEESEVEITDEDYARQLDEEFHTEELEFQRQLERVQMQQQQQPCPSSLERTTSSNSARDRRLARAESKSRHYYARTESTRTESLSDDASPSAPPIINGGNYSYYETAPPPRRNSRKGTASTSGSYLSDAEYALRLQQEEQDEHLARQWIAEEEARRNAAAVRAAQRAPPPRKKTCCQKFLSCMCCLIIVAMVVGVCLYFFVFSGDDVQNWWKDPQVFQGEDPFNNANPEDANLWRMATRQQGLELTILNCLDNAWQDYFIQAVDDWDAGVPDALDLKTEVGTPESVCTPVDNVMKVCNGDYGETNWRGINKILLENGYIYSSAARMNEFYFGKGASNDQAQRQYTMCHEMGKPIKKSFCLYKQSGPDAHFVVVFLLLLNQVTDLDFPTRTKISTTRIWGIAWTTPLIRKITSNPHLPTFCSCRSCTEHYRDPKFPNLEKLTEMGSPRRERLNPIPTITRPPIQTCKTAKMMKIETEKNAEEELLVVIRQAEYLELCPFLPRLRLLWRKLTFWWITVKSDRIGAVCTNRRSGWHTKLIWAKDTQYKFTCSKHSEDL